VPRAPCSMPALVTARYLHACCVVRGKLVVLGGLTSDYRAPSSVAFFGARGVCGAPAFVVRVSATKSQSGGRELQETIAHPSQEAVRIRR
jgi:hypothetical protein